MLYFEVLDLSLKKTCKFEYKRNKNTEKLEGFKKNQLFEEVQLGHFALIAGLYPCMTSLLSSCTTVDRSTESIVQAGYPNLTLYTNISSQLKFNNKSQSFQNN